MPSHNVTTNWQRNGETISQTVTATGDGEVNADITVAASASNFAAALTVDVSTLQSLLISSDKDLTIETNDSGTPDDTLTIKANNPLVWVKDNGITCPLTVDVTDLYFTRTGGGAGTGDATVKIRTIQDFTP